MHWSAEIKIHNDFPNFPNNIINLWFDHLRHIIESVQAIWQESRGEWNLILLIPTPSTPLPPSH